MGQVQSSDRQRNIIYYLVHQGKGRTEAARLAGFAAPRQSAFNLMQSPNIITKVRQERNKVYQTELASTSVHTLKEVMEDTDAPASARIAAARTSLELAGDIGKHSQSQRNYEQNLAEMTPEELSAIIDKWEGEKAAIAKDITPV
ncbi:MAG: hypothetical protein HOC08_02415 [Deltaproteobacteria bacterium]|jgi:hypothetical protein|nr:hypothetical protein [Deltaproteobacteria bacterium]